MRGKTGVARYPRGGTRLEGPETRTGSDIPTLAGEVGKGEEVRSPILPTTTPYGVWGGVGVEKAVVVRWGDHAGSPTSTKGRSLPLASLPVTTTSMPLVTHVLSIEAILLL